MNCKPSFLPIFFLSSLFFALMFLSCSDPQRDNPNDPGGINYQGHRSSSSSPPAVCNGALVCVMNASQVVLGDRIEPAPTVRCGNVEIDADQVSWTPASLAFTNNADIGTRIVYARVGNNNPVGCTPAITVTQPSAGSYCGGEMYDPETHFCLDNIKVGEKCGGEEYNPTKYFCLGSTITPLCGGNTFTSSQFCSGNSIENKCGGTVTFTPGTQDCCGNSRYTLATQFCSGNKVYNKCRGSDYNPSTHFCLGSTVTPLCGGETYTSSQFCSGNSIENKCGDTVTFTPGTQDCCGNGRYTLATQFCSGNAVYNKCGGSDYNPSTQYCSNGTVKTYGTISYGGQTYKTVVIGTQTWMAENLNYDVPGTTTDVCYGNQSSNCAQYGRLYNWSTAMNNSASSSAVPSGRQGVCPSGWHIPSYGEWTALTDFVDVSTAGTKLKAASGWNNNGNGTDEFGFSALPGGYGGSVGSFTNVGYYGYWWSSTESDSDNAYYWIVFNSISHVDRSNYSKSGLLSVRCVQD